MSMVANRNTYFDLMRKYVAGALSADVFVNRYIALRNADVNEEWARLSPAEHRREVKLVRAAFGGSISSEEFRERFDRLLKKDPKDRPIKALLGRGFTTCNVYYPDADPEDPSQIDAEELRSDIADLLEGERILRIVTDMEDRAEAFLELSRWYYSGTDADRETIRSVWDFGLAWDYPDREHIVWSRRDTETSQDRAKAFLLYCDLTNALATRDRMMAYATIYNGCKLVGLDPDVVMERVAQCAQGVEAASLRRFLRRPEKRKSLEAFKLKVVETREGYRIVSMVSERGL